jgi:hypothetical protein
VHGRRPLSPVFVRRPSWGNLAGLRAKKGAGDVTLEHEPPALTIGIG